VSAESQVGDMPSLHTTHASLEKALTHWVRIAGTTLHTPIIDGQVPEKVTSNELLLLALMAIEKKMCASFARQSPKYFEYPLTNFSMPPCNRVVGLKPIFPSPLQTPA